MSASKLSATRNAQLSILKKAWQPLYLNEVNILFKNENYIYLIKIWWTITAKTLELWAVKRLEIEE